MKYCQCKFAHKTNRTSAWIPTWAARIGNEVQLKDSEDPNIFWSLIAVGCNELDEATIRSQERNYREFQGSTKGGGID